MHGYTESRKNLRSINRLSNAVWDIAHVIQFSTETHTTSLTLAPKCWTRVSSVSLRSSLKTACSNRWLLLLLLLLLVTTVRSNRFSGGSVIQRLISNGNERSIICNTRQITRWTKYIFTDHVWNHYRTISRPVFYLVIRNTTHRSGIGNIDWNHDNRIFITCVHCIMYTRRAHRRSRWIHDHDNIDVIIRVRSQISQPIVKSSDR